MEGKQLCLARSLMEESHGGWMGLAIVQILQQQLCNVKTCRAEHMCVSGGEMYNALEDVKVTCDDDAALSCT